MLLGIDVGGTFTDAVLLEQGRVLPQTEVVDKGRVLAQAKKETTHEDVLVGILQALDGIMSKVELQKNNIQRVVISSTIVTNAITENKIDPVFLAVITGPGRNMTGQFPVEPVYLSGYVDHRGQVTAPIDWKQHESLKNLKGRGRAAASSKFSVRNPSQELELGAQLEKLGFTKVFLGSKLSGELNFVRRTNSAYYAAAVYGLFETFCHKIKAALKARGIQAPVHILKADGGTLPLEIALEQPVEAIFTGPAASVLGIEALAAPEINSISLDVGGTTTDIAFWEKGMPLMARKGAAVKGYPTSVRAFHMRSIGIGGDSRLTKLDNGKYQVGPERQGKAAALGGTVATLSDALIVSGYVSFGDRELSLKALSCFGDPVAEAGKIVAAAVAEIQSTIEEMLVEWAKQPVYTVDDVIKGTEFVPEQLIGVGGGSLGLIKALGEAMGLRVDIPVGAMVANAIGAAVARPTLIANLRADTTENSYLIPESGKRERIRGDFNKRIASDILGRWLLEQTEAWQLPDRQTEIITFEHFTTFHSYYDTGDIYNLRMQLKPGILCKVEGKEVEF